MGMYNSLYVQCPQCNHRIEFQSKAGNCSLDRYKLQNCPPEIALDLDRESKECDHCGSVVVLHSQVISTIMAFLKDADDGYDIEDDKPL